MEYLTKDGKKFNDLDKALAHESALGVAEKQARKEKYEEVVRLVAQAQKAIQEYNKIFNDKIKFSVDLHFSDIERGTVNKDIYSTLKLSKLLNL